MYNHHALRSLVLSALLLACAGLASAAATFPFNGSFELISTGKPVGWQVDGCWFVRPDAAVDGRNGVTVMGDYGKQGAKLSTTGYLLANDEPLDLSFSYVSPTGSVSYALIYCDTLGNRIATSAWECLPASESWCRYEREIMLPAVVVVSSDSEAEEGEIPTADEQPVTEAPPAEEPAVEAPVAEPPAADAEAAPAEGEPVEGEIATPPAPRQVKYAGVRLVFRLDANGAQIKLDNVKLAHASATSPLVKPPKIKAELRPNLLPNSTLEAGPTGAPQGWQPLADSGHDGELATVEPVGTSRALALESGADMGAAWLADPVLLDGAMPYRLDAQVDARELTDATVRLVINLLDPQDNEAVWVQYEASVMKGYNGAVSLVLPRLWTEPGAVLAQVALAVGPKGCGQALARGITLCPEPLSVSVRSASVAGGFKKPSDVSLFVSAVNNTYAVLKPKALLEVRDADGNTVASETRAIVIGSRSAAYFPYKPKLRGDGAYKLSVSIVNSGRQLGSCTYDFRVGQTPAVVTPAPEATP